jgi:Na+-transporting NADH:ubiquinone oxidoreductase subunit C
MAFSNGYIIGFAGAICVGCSIFVAGSAVALREQQELNAVVDKQTQVLKVAGLVKEGEVLTPAEVGKRFEENLVPKLVDLKTGDYVEGDAANYDMDAAMKDPAQSSKAPPNDAKVASLPNHGLVYELKGEGDKVSAYIIPVEGKGLWSTLKGFVALEPDTTTVAGLTFYSHKETPGLGGEVDNPKWKALWPGRKVFDDKWAPKLEVIKGQAGAPADDPYRVDGLSGATLTSRGVTYLVQFWVGPDAFGPYLEKKRGGAK